VFDAGQKCLLGIMSRKFTVSPTSGAHASEKKDIAKYFVPASAIRAFIPPEYRFEGRCRARKRQAPKTATGQIASITLLAIPAILLLTQVTAAQQRPPGQSAPSLIVTPSTSIAFSGPRGGPFAPSLVEYRVSASTGTVNYSIRTPSWLTASSISG